jgi:hypothetical protein
VIGDDTKPAADPLAPASEPVPSREGSHHDKLLAELLAAPLPPVPRFQDEPELLRKLVEEYTAWRIEARKRPLPDWAQRGQPIRPSADLPPAELWFHGLPWIAAERAADYIAARFGVELAEAHLRLTGLLRTDAFRGRWIDVPGYLQWRRVAANCDEWFSVALTYDSASDRTLITGLPPAELSPVGVEIEVAGLLKVLPEQPRKRRLGRPSLVDPALVHMKQRHDGGSLLPTRDEEVDFQLNWLRSTQQRAPQDKSAKPKLRARYQELAQGDKPGDKL